MSPLIFSEISPSVSNDRHLVDKMDGFEVYRIGEIQSLKSRYLKKDRHIPDISIMELLRCLKVLDRFLKGICDDPLSQNEMVEKFLPTITKQQNELLNNSDKFFNRNAPNGLSEKLKAERVVDWSKSGVSVRHLSDYQRKLVRRHIAFMFLTKNIDFDFYFGMAKKCVEGKVFLKYVNYNDGKYLFFSHDVDFVKKYPFDPVFPGKIKNGVVQMYPIRIDLEVLRFEKTKERILLSEFLKKLKLNAPIEVSKEVEDRLIWVNNTGDISQIDVMSVVKSVCFACGLFVNTSNSGMLIDSINRRKIRYEYANPNQLFNDMIPSNIQSFLKLRLQQEGVQDNNRYSLESKIFSDLRHLALNKFVDYYNREFGNTDKIVDFKMLSNDMKNIMSLVILLDALSGFAFVKGNFDFLVRDFEDLWLSGGVREYGGVKDFVLDYCKKFSDGSLAQGAGFSKILRR